jgi:hypothetical protein
MGRAGYEKTRAKFTWDMVTDRLERIYRNLIGGSPRPYYASHTEVRL